MHAASLAGRLLHSLVGNTEYCSRKRKRKKKIEKATPDPNDQIPNLGEGRHDINPHPLH